jgi:glycosyltransferase involved in cell wall biosynthesis
MSGKIKAVWICHFSNKEIQDILKPKKKVNEMAPWIPFLAKVLEDHNDVELHVVAPHQHIRGIKHFTLRNINYHFFNPNIFFYRWSLLDLYNFNIKTEYIYNKLIIRYIVNKIKPDLIHLQGAENVSYSSSIFQFKDKYPILITIQGFLHKVAGTECSLLVKKQVECELKIYKTFKHFGIRTETMGKVVKEFNPNAVLHWHGYGIKITLPGNVYNKEKKYDLLFFARIDKIKGIEDLLKSISIIKKQKGNINSIIIGSCSNDYMVELKGICRNLGIENNVTWAGFLPAQADVHEAASEARICVLPVQYDMIPGTIIESMLLKIPVVAYNVGSIHEVNEKEEVISLVDKDDINGLVEAVMAILKNEKEYKERAEKGYKRVIEMIDIKNVYADILKAYTEVIADFNQK